MRDKDIGFSIFFQNPHHFSEQVVEVEDMFKDTPAVYLVHGMIREKRQSAFNVCYNVHLGRINAIDADAAILFFGAAADIDHNRCFFLD